MVNTNPATSDKRQYTLKIIPHQEGSVHTIHLPIKSIQCILTLCLSVIIILIGSFVYLSYDAKMTKEDEKKLKNLQQIHMGQQEKILRLSKEAASLQVELEKLQQLENEIRRLHALQNKKAATIYTGQGGPRTPPNAENLEETMDSLQKRMTQQKRSLKNLQQQLEEKRIITTMQIKQQASTPSIQPTTGNITSPYGLRWNGSDFHPGIDIANQVGTPIQATADGLIIESGWNAHGYGYMIDIDHGNGVVTRYAHNSRLASKKGERVKKGQVIAYMGNTGLSTGSHCHYEVRIGGRAVNPNKYL